MASIEKKMAKDGSVSYIIRVSNGYNSEGRQLRKSTSYKPSTNMTPKQIQRELNRQATLFEEKVKKGYAINENIKFCDYAEIWLQHSKPSLAPKTYVRYKELLVRINQAIGHIKISKLQPTHLKEFYNNLGEIISKRTGEPLSKQTIRHYHRCVSTILATATKEQIIARNIASREFMDAPKVSRKEPRHLSQTEAKLFVSLLMKEEIKVKTALLLLIYSGIRNGELCGLEWQDVDFQNKKIDILRASQYVNGYGVITKEPKNQTSKRTIRLTDNIFAILTEYKRWYDEQREASGDHWVNSNRLFVQGNGKGIAPSTVAKWLQKFIEKHELPKITPHSFRHTFCTLLIASGVDIKTVSHKAGHSRTSTTLDIYTHAVQSADEQASQILDSVLSPQDNVVEFAKVNGRM